MNSNMQREVAVVFKLLDEWEQRRIAKLFSAWLSRGRRWPCGDSGHSFALDLPELSEPFDWLVEA